MIPFLDLKLTNSRFKNEFQDKLEKIIASGWYILGPELNSFEAEFANYCSTKFCIGVGNGLDAITLSLLALNIKPGDQVIVPSNTYIATWLAITSVGATPIPVEPLLNTYNINPDLIERALTKKTKAIIPVHLYGQAAEMQRIMYIAEKHSLFVIEDNAQAQGGKFCGKTTGSWGHINATSFYPGKNLGALGDGGAITTDNELLAEKIKTIRNYGSKIKYYNDIIGVNSRLDEIQASWLRVKLIHLEADNQKRKIIAEHYNNRLQATDNLILPFVSNDCSHVFHLYVIRTNKRDELQKYLKSKQIETIIHYPVPPHLQKAYSYLKFKKGNFPIAEEIASTCLSLPIYPGLSPNKIDYICESINSFFKNA